MKIYEIKQVKDTTLKDEQIKPSHYLYPLTKKYDVKISMSNASKGYKTNEYGQRVKKSETYYIYKTQYGYRIRIGHKITNKNHIQNFSVNYEVEGIRPLYAFVEKIINRHLKDLDRKR